MLIFRLSFIELANPRFVNLGRRLTGLRDGDSLLTANLLLIFVGLDIARVVMIVAG